MKSGYGPCQPKVDEASSDRDAGRNHRNLIATEPLGIRDLDGIAHNLTVQPISAESEHQRMRERPWLAADVAHVANGHTDFFHRFPDDGFFERLPRLDETRETRIHGLLPLDTACQKRLFVITLAARHERDDCGCKPREGHESACRATHRAFVVETLRGFATSTAESVRACPLDKLHGTTRRQPVVFVAAAVKGEEIDRGAVGRVETMGNVDRPHCDVTHHADEVNVPVACGGFVGFPDVGANDVEIAVSARVCRRFHRRNQARNIGVTAHTASTVPA